MANMAANRSESTAEKPTFTCASCGFQCNYEYFGKKPPFSKSVVLLEDAYVIRDPFSPNAGHLTLGGQCCVCARHICMSQTCSIFYTKRFCIPCVQNNKEEFPDEILKDLQKKDPSCS
ncbi:cysteine-rich DPF motif domain-containing protein 1-like [Stylophora pistillata]|uniref:cysteine-rich DPF motif domain-containing protein 1-like n=1 Tax=Stylophora pistillata TaxID=50429 RepID=UPI000C03DF4B|nr:cysteine-rich DPF motif domain-containing protein 1-like [Stylophora pistillata]